MDQYGTEDEQLEALKRWWDENGKLTVAAVVIALASGFGWRAFQDHRTAQAELASDLYQSMLRIVEAREGNDQAVDLGEQIKRDHGSSTYAQFAGLHLAAMAVERGDLAEAEAQLRWVLGRAEAGGDIDRVAQLRLARVVAASGDADQALAIIDGAGPGTYGASFAAAKGDILLAVDRSDEARLAYGQALALAGPGGNNLPVIQQKLDSLTPAPLSVIEDAAPATASEVPAESAGEAAEAEPQADPQAILQDTAES